MYRNLEAELARQGLTKKAIAEHLNVRYATVSDKFRGKYKFTLDEALEIRDTFFPEQDFEYLFQRKTSKRHDK